MSVLRLLLDHPLSALDEAKRAISSCLQRFRWIESGIALIAGAVATLGHAPFYFAPLYFIAIVILIRMLDLAALRSNRIAAAFGLAWWFGVGHFTSGLYWLSAAFAYDFGAWGSLAGACAVLALAAVLACFWGAGCALAITLWTRDFRRVPVFAAAVASSEWLRGVAFTGFPWLLPGYVWPAGEPVSQSASVVGIYGLSALTLLFAAAPVVLWDRATKPARRFAPLLFPVIVFAGLWIWGGARLAQSPATQSDPPVVRVADSGLRQADKWIERPDQEFRVLQHYLAASGAAGEADIIIWPEGAIPSVNSFVLENAALMDALGAAISERTLVLGLTRRAQRGERLAYYNSAVVIANANGRPEMAEIYDKHRLVPFGEYIPFWRVFSGLNIAPLQRIGTGFEPGASPPRQVRLPNAPAATILICYEAIFPGLAPRGADRPAWIISLTNDAWFGDGAGPWQHFAIARYRAIETGLPMARAASGGVSAIVDSHGRVVAANRGAGFAEARLPAPLPETLFARFGLATAALLVLIIALLRIVPIRAQARAAGKQATTRGSSGPSV
ncbi:MAG: apolipoprotein N-acyltransferase [Hyphomonadaceae bacterium]